MADVKLVCGLCCEPINETVQEVRYKAGLCVCGNCSTKSEQEIRKAFQNRMIHVSVIGNQLLQ